MASERYLEVLVSRAPEIVFGAGYRLIAQQLTLPSGRVDLVLGDEAGTKHLVELKKDIAKPEAVDQVQRYMEDYRRRSTGKVVGWVVANGISPAAQQVASTVGIRTLAVPEAAYAGIRRAKNLSDADMFGDRVLPGILMGGGVQSFPTNGTSLEAALSELQEPVRGYVASLSRRKGFDLACGKMQIAVIYKGVKIGGLNRAHRHIFVSSNIVLGEEDERQLQANGFVRVTKTQASSAHVHVYWKAGLSETSAADRVFKHFCSKIDDILFC